MKFKLYDLSHPFSINTPSPVGYPSPIIQWAKRGTGQGSFSTVISTHMHLATHVDAPSHWVGPTGKDMGGVPIEDLFGKAVIADLTDVADDWYLIRPKDITSRVKVAKGDILVIKTGYHKYYGKDEERYYFMHPGGDQELAEWCVRMKLKWLGVDLLTPDHPMATKSVPELRPNLVKKYEKKIGKNLEKIYPRENVNPMHKLLLPKGILLIENIGGDISSLPNKECYIGAFPWKFTDGDGSICRLVAFDITD